jgi:hypothetical protein
MATGQQADIGPSQVWDPSMKTLKALCHPRPSVFDPSKRDTVLDITDLIDRKINATEFFAENYVTDGMRTLLVEGFRRLESRSSQGVFKLTQAMGGVRLAACWERRCRP